MRVGVILKRLTLHRQRLEKSSGTAFHKNLTDGLVSETGTQMTGLALSPDKALPVYFVNYAQ